MGTNIPSPTTPIKAHASSDTRVAQLSGDTPTHRKTSADYHGPEYKVELSRTAVLHDIGPGVPEVAFQFFCDHLLPRLHPNVNIKGVIKKLQESGDITDDGRWQVFPKDPYTYAKNKIDIRATENKVFGNLTSVIEAIEKHSGVPANFCTTQYKSLPHMTPIGCFDKKDGKPDGFFCLESRHHDPPGGRRYYWRDITAAAEFKLLNTQEALQDVSLRSFSTISGSPHSHFLSCETGYRKDYGEYA
jgi:hypothetical protein